MVCLYREQTFRLCLSVVRIAVGKPLLICKSASLLFLWGLLTCLLYCTEALVCISGTEKLCVRHLWRRVCSSVMCDQRHWIFTIRQLEHFVNSYHFTIIINKLTESDLLSPVLESSLHTGYDRMSGQKTDLTDLNSAQHFLPQEEAHHHNLEASLSSGWSQICFPSSSRIIVMKNYLVFLQCPLPNTTWSVLQGCGYIASLSLAVQVCYWPVGNLSAWINTSQQQVVEAIRIRTGSDGKVHHWLFGLRHNVFIFCPFRCRVIC